jgi:hypothetical protein
MEGKRKAKTRLRKKQGIWVLGGTSKITVEGANRLIDEMRREREEQILGPGFKTRKKGSENRER